MSARSTGSEKARWRSLKIWASDPTREMAAHGEALYISYFQAPEIDVLVRSTKSVRKDKNRFRPGKVPFRWRFALLGNPRVVLGARIARNEVGQLADLFHFQFNRVSGF
jgi:hypothetical protein